MVAGVIVEAERALLRALASRPPREVVAQELLTGPARFGPFGPGDVVKVHATARAWVLFGDSRVRAERGRGVPLDAWAGATFAVSGDHVLFVSVALDEEPPPSEEPPPLALAWAAGNLRSDTWP